MNSDIKKEFKEFLKKHPDDAYLKISIFLNNYRIKYEENKIQEYLSQGYDEALAHRKSRNSWVAFVGKQLENLIMMFLEDFCNENNLKMIKGDQLKRSVLNSEYSCVRRKIQVHFNEYSLLPDADIVIYKKINNTFDVKVIAILSIKNSFRERYTETPYWKLKLMQDEVTKPIKVFMVTPDNDDEISFITRNGPKQSRIVLEYELDSIYLAREEFNGSDKVKGLDQLLIDLKKIINE